MRKSVAPEQIARAILVLRGNRVLLDAELAALTMYLPCAACFRLERGASVSGSDLAAALSAPYQYCDVQGAHVVRAGGDGPETSGFGCDSHIRRLSS
jgi:hypothetical protein